MKRGYPPVWLSALILALLLIWKMLGAPITAQQFRDLETPFWQAQALLPSRMGRIMLLWMPVQIAQPQTETLMDEEMNADEREMARITRQADGEPMISVYVAQENRLVEMTLEGYVCGVVAAEMPAAYHLEALKAQAVAARTRAVFQMQNGGCGEHDGADICSDSAHCQGYATLASCLEKWGEEYDVYRERILTASKETGHLLILYEDEPITVMYHAISGGKTEAAQTVFSESLPYLVSVDSAGEEGVRGFYSDRTLTFEEVAGFVNAAVPELNATADDIRQTFLIGNYTPTGRVAQVLLCGREIPASVLRQALGLRSTWFTVSTDAEGITFHQRGYGHGVGMSQAGANSMAAQGKDYRDILLHYYPGTSVERR